MSILMDIIILAIYYPSGELWSSTEKFSAVMAIFNLTLRWISSIYSKCVYHVWFRNSSIIWLECDYWILHFHPRFGAILVLYQNYQDRQCKRDDNWGYVPEGTNHKVVESIYGKTIGGAPSVHNQTTAASMIGGVSLYSTQHPNHKSNAGGSVLSHPGSNNNLSTTG